MFSRPKIFPLLYRVQLGDFRPRLDQVLFCKGVVSIQQPQWKNVNERREKSERGSYNNERRMESSNDAVT